MSGPKPLGVVGPLGTAVCPRPGCGGSEGRRPGHCGTCGGFLFRNSDALVSSAHSMAFALAAEDEAADITAAVIADAGHTPEAAPKALQLAARSLAEAATLRASCYRHLTAMGGPLTTIDGRPRRAYEAWLQASDRVAVYLRVVGLRRVPRKVDLAMRLAGQPETEEDA